jgi:hypothetical protein
LRALAGSDIPFEPVQVKTETFEADLEGRVHGNAKAQPLFLHAGWTDYKSTMHPGLGRSIEKS